MARCQTCWHIREVYVEALDTCDCGFGYCVNHKFQHGQHNWSKIEETKRERRKELITAQGIVVDVFPKHDSLIQLSFCSICEDREEITGIVEFDGRYGNVKKEVCQECFIQSWKTLSKSE